MWTTIVKYAVKVALYAANHPDEVIALVQAVKTAKEEK